VHSSLWLRRMRLAFAFDLVSPAISWKLGVVARMRRFRATSSGHKLITDTSLLCAQRTGLEPIVFRRQVSARVVAHDCSTERPLPADVRTAQPGKLYVRSATHAGCMCAASSCWITTAHMDFACRCDRAVRLVPFGTSTVEFLRTVGTLRTRSARVAP
jgi:hypothetical protein